MLWNGMQHLSVPGEAQNGNSHVEEARMRNGGVVLPRGKKSSDCSLSSGHGGLFYPSNMFQREDLENQCQVI